VIVKADVSALILAGGRATRLGGVAKHAILIDGETILARLVRVLEPRVAELLVGVGSAGAIEGIGGQRPPLRPVRDAVADVGPLAGVAAGLASATTPWMIVVAGDMPFLSGSVIDALTRTADPEIDAVGIMRGGRPEPLVCALRVSVARPAVERMLAGGRFKASHLLTAEGLAVRWIEDLDPGALRNINSPDDLPG